MLTLEKNVILKCGQDASELLVVLTCYQSSYSRKYDFKFTPLAEM